MVRETTLRETLESVASSRSPFPRTITPARETPCALEPYVIIIIIRARVAFVVVAK